MANLCQYMNINNLFILHHVVFMEVQKKLPLIESSRLNPLSH